MTNKKKLIVYFSLKGQTYIDGDIVFLPVGNTEVVAKKIQSMTDSDLFEIKTVDEYPEDHMVTIDVAKRELKNNARPELTNTVENMDSYDVIYLGYPNWWGTFPMAVFTFLESYDFSGKTIFPFCTHEGSALVNSERDIKKLCPNAKVLSGLAIRGGSVKTSDNRIKSWISKQ